MFVVRHKDWLIRVAAAASASLRVKPGKLFGGVGGFGVFVMSRRYADKVKTVECIMKIRRSSRERFVERQSLFYTCSHGFRDDDHGSRFFIKIVLQYGFKG